MILDAFKIELQGNCTFCSWQPGKYQIPGLRGLFCSMECIETELFGICHCRWCGKDMEKPYTSVDSRLCSADCSEEYYAHVMGDRTAALGTGARFVRWLQRQQPKAYAALIGEQHLGRPAIGGWAMTGAERARRHRERTKVA